MSFNYSYNYNEKQNSSFFEMMGLNKRAVDNINESEDICSSYAPDFVIEQEDESYIKSYDDENSIMNFTPFENDITSLFEDDENTGVNYSI